MIYICKISAIFFCLESLLLFTNFCCCTTDNDEAQNGSHKYRVDGTVSVPFTADQSWTANTRVIVDGGYRLAFLRSVLITVTGHFGPDTFGIIQLYSPKPPT